MAYLVLARKWRPQRFEDVVGQEHVTTTLRNAIAQQRIAHAFLFSGPRGVGKTTVARLLAKALNCEQGPTGEPCGVCSSCTEIAAGSALDVVEIDGASNTGVDNIRDLNENVRYRPASARFKIYIIDEVHMLSTAAFNALLKTLEEPPPHIKFIFATTEVQKLPQTVVSRCQRYEFKRIPIAALTERLATIVADEGITATDTALFELAREADGSLRDAQSLLDQVIVFAGKAIGDDEVRGALGVADRRVLHQVTEAILRRDPAPCLRAVDELYRYGYEVAQFCRDLVRQVRNLTVASLYQDASLLTDLPDNEVQETLRQAALRSPDDLQRLFRIVQAGFEEIRKSVLPKLVLEMTLLKMATMPETEPVGTLIARLEEMERRLAAGGDGSDASGADRGTGRGTPAAPPRSGGSRAAEYEPPARSSVRETPPVSARDQSQPPVVAQAQAGAPGRAQSAATAPAVAAPAPQGSPIADGAASGGASAVRESNGWRTFLAAAQAKISLKMCLSGSRCVDDAADLLHIGVASDFAQRALSQRDNVSVMQEIALRAYGMTKRIQVSVVKAVPEDLAVRQAADAARRRDLTARAAASESVRAAVEILGGEITDVRPRRRATEEPE